MNSVIEIEDIRIDLTVPVDMSESPVSAECSYRARVPEPENGGAPKGVPRLEGRLYIQASEEPELWRRLGQLAAIFRDLLPTHTLKFDNESLTFQGTLIKYRLIGDRVQVDRQIRNVIDTVVVPPDDLTDSQQDLVQSVVSSCRRLAWQDLKQSLNPQGPASRPGVFISYRKGHESFAGSIAARLHQEGLEPWYDEWEVVAGDSLPGKIEAAFESSTVFIPILTKDYREGKWANEELENAIAKRVGQGYRIVPVLFDAEARIPELLQALVYVDCSNHEPDEFEKQMRQLIDGVYGLSRNPYR